MTEIELWNLQHIDLLADLSATEIEAVLDAVSVETFEPGEFVIAPSSRSDRLYLLYHGRVKSFVVTKQGQEKILHIFSSGDAFGDLLLEPATIERPCVQALDEVVLLTMDEDTFKRLIQAVPQVALNLCRYMAAHHAADVRRLRSFIHTKAIYRLVLMLLELGDQLGQSEAEYITFNANFTHADLANMIGVARGTASELLSELRRAGIISGKGRELIIHRRAAQRFLEEGNV
ncbi:MAG: Crp/Fnr family transcriptional regulator [Chloroflexota bacterium]|nr:Crp/Fnr family transcriptional regulator [Chloroflexota bacterium]